MSLFSLTSCLLFILQTPSSAFHPFSLYFFSFGTTDYLKTLSTSRTTQRQIIGWLLNNALKSTYEIFRGLTGDTIPKFTWRNWPKRRKPVRVVGCVVILSFHPPACRFSGPFAQPRKVRISLDMSVRPSVRAYLRGSHWADFRKIWYWGILWKSIEKVQIWLKSNKNIGRFTRRTRLRFVLAGSIFLHCWQW